MPHQVHESQSSYASNESANTQPSTDTQQTDERAENREERPRGPRVRFRSIHQVDNNEEVRGLISGREEVEQRQREQRPSMPEPQPSADVTDQAAPSEDERKAREEKNKEKEEKEERPREGVGDKIKDVIKSRDGNRLRAVGQSAKEKTRRLAHLVGRTHTKGDPLTSATSQSDWGGGGDIPLSDMTDNKHKSDEDRRQGQATSTSEAHRLVREMTQDQASRRRKMRPAQSGGQSTPVDGGESDAESELRYRSGGGGILSQLLKLYGNQPGSDSASMKGQRPSDSETETEGPSRPSSGTSTPKKEKLKWYKKPQSQSTVSLVGASSNLSATGTPIHSGEIMSAAAKRRSRQGGGGKPRLEDEIRVTVHIAEIISRQRYLMQLCRALMKFGAPTHRLEEYMQMTARVLEVDGQFLYLPGCMIMSFDDPSTRTTEVKLIRVAQGVDLARLADTHNVYKNVVHDLIGVEEAIQQLDEIMKRKPRFNKWILVLVTGLASTAIGPFAFEARPIDMPIIFFLGCLLGVMRYIIAPNSALYANVFEVFASVLTSFLSRAIGSIRRGMPDGTPNYIFCFSSMAQSSIALILPGFLVLCSSLELQSHQIIAGSIRMVYAIIYSLFLGYGITVGTTIYGLMDPKANSQVTCPPSPIKNQYLQRFPFVALAAVFLALVNQAKWKQVPVMVFIAMAGYIVNFFSTKRLGSNTQVANTLGAFTLGVLGNLYSRLWHGHAATAILPAIFVLVPSGLAATGSLISGVQSANEIRGNVTQSGNATNRSNQSGNTAFAAGPQNAVANLGYGMVQVAIGITVGLFLAALVVYPYGKRRSGLFSF